MIVCVYYYTQIFPDCCMISETHVTVLLTYTINTRKGVIQKGCLNLWLLESIVNIMTI